LKVLNFLQWRAQAQMESTDHFAWLTGRMEI
jgi:hypothetical protein